jgi:hypothetical protein
LDVVTDAGLIWHIIILFQVPMRLIPSQDPPRVKLRLPLNLVMQTFMVVLVVCVDVFCGILQGQVLNVIRIGKEEHAREMNAVIISVELPIIQEKNVKIGKFSNI